VGISSAPPETRASPDRTTYDDDLRQRACATQSRATRRTETVVRPPSPSTVKVSKSLSCVPVGSKFGIMSDRDDQGQRTEVALYRRILANPFGRSVRAAKDVLSVASFRYAFLGTLLLVGFNAFSACSLTVDLDYLQDRYCSTKQKLCNDKCVSKTDPQTGCAADACVPCTLAQATANCTSNGLCAIAACLRSYRDCNRMEEDGCEIDIDHDPDHCGTCTAPPCVVANAVPDCAAGRCAIRVCNDGYGDCNQMAGDGCETNLQTNSSHCSVCNTPCPAGAACVGGKCQ
jgi:hypothetical protein